jgi:L-2-hydroxyglutarate oxidase LhgO
MSAYKADVVVVGGGLVGLATAWQLQRRRPGLRVLVLEKEDRLAAHQSGHNSGVVHSGVYYQPGSLKAQLCVRGKQQLEEFIERRGIRYQRCGKVIVASDERELGRLRNLRERGERNGVPGLRELNADELREIEPHVVGVRGLHVPGTAITDFPAVAGALAREVIDAGGEVRTSQRVTELRSVADGTLARAASGLEAVARIVVTCGGLQSDLLARGMGVDPAVHIVPFRGDYYTLVPEARALVRGLVYPVPDPALPFLGVHFTPTVDGSVWAGPNAVLALAREGYRRRDVDRRELADVLRFPGFRHLARRYWRLGAEEIWRDVSKRAYVRSLQRYIPDIRPEQLVFGPSGVRAQALDATGVLVDDFRIVQAPGVCHVVNAPSPAATASLGIGDVIAERVVEQLGS